jgi:hypothetical protein
MDGVSYVIDDPIDHPAHYTQYKVEVIDLIEGMPYCRACAIKYIARAGYKPPANGQTQGEKELEDLRKAAWMIEREIQRLSVTK